MKKNSCGNVLPPNMSSEQVQLFEKYVYECIDKHIENFTNHNPKLVINLKEYKRIDFYHFYQPVLEQLEKDGYGIFYEIVLEHKDIGPIPVIKQLILTHQNFVAIERTCISSIIDNYILDMRQKGLCFLDFRLSHHFNSFEDVLKEKGIGGYVDNKEYALFLPETLEDGKKVYIDDESRWFRSFTEWLNDIGGWSHEETDDGYIKLVKATSVKSAI